MNQRVASFIVFAALACTASADSLSNKLMELRGNLKITKSTAGLGHDTPFCRAVLRDLRTWQNVSIVKPFHRAQSMDDPEVKRSFGACPLEEMSQLHVDRGGGSWRMESNLALYRLDPYNKREKTQMQVLRGTFTSSDRESGGFLIIDQASCTSNFVSFFDRDESYSGILRRRGNHYFFDVVHFPAEGSYGITVYSPQYRTKQNDFFFTAACLFCAPDDSEEPLLLVDKARWTRCEN